MVNVVSSVYIKQKLPNFIQALAEEVQSICYYAFEDDDMLSRFVNMLQERIKILQKEGRGSLILNHTVIGSSGNISIFSKGATEQRLMMMISYFKLQGHVRMKKDDRGIRTEPFLQPID